MVASAMKSPKHVWLTVWTYTSLMAPEGLGPQLKIDFEKQCQCKTTWETMGDAGQLLGRTLLSLERGSHGPDVVLGLDHYQWNARGAPLDKAAIRDVQLQSIKQKELVDVAGRTGNGFWPLDWGALAWMEKTPDPKSPRKTLRVEDFLAPKWEKKLLLQDPRTSTTGWIWVQMTAQILQERFEMFWKTFRNQWRTLSVSWDDAYGLFLKGEAPLVWSYVTSEAYHKMAGEKEYRYIAQHEGHPYQVEGAVIVKASPRAIEFVRYLWSEAAQSKVPTKQWMLPVRKKQKLPEAFRPLQTIRTLEMPHAVGATKLIERWGQAIRD